VDPRDLAEQIVFATLVDLLDEGYIEFRPTECEPTFMPPFPQKRWTLLVHRRRELPSFPLADVLGCAFDLIEQRLRKRGDPAPYFIALDEIIEQSVKAMRQELSFWQRAGVYGDIRSYIESALVAQGYLVMPPRETWLERLRSARPAMAEGVSDLLRDRAADLRTRLEAFRKAHGNPPPEGPLPDQHPRTLHDVDPAIIDTDLPPEEMPLYDCLRVALCEALVCLRQLEPGDDTGGL